MNKDIKTKIDVKNLNLFYGSNQALFDIDVNLYQNKITALIGPSGCGKTTLINLLMRFYDPQGGKITIDDVNIEDMNREDLRKMYGMVLQDSWLFKGTIKENIAYGKPNATEEEIVTASKQANAYNFIESFPEKFETIVGERGIKLSGGQRQRIAIARALLKNPSILILDEATSSLDSKSEKLVQEALEILMEGRTSIIIAHRLSTIRSADQILVLDNGKITEQGTHQELIALENGIYKNLSNLQFSHS